MGYSVHDLQDTIVAPATPPGVGAIGVLRLAGPEAVAIADRLFPAKDLFAQKSHTAHYGTLRDPLTNRLLDEVVLTLFRAPRSYTGDDVVEISCHGSPYIMQQVLQACTEQGARLAQPGEFTLRAFLNGKMDLSQAEAVADLIASGSEAAHRVALRQMRGGFSDDIAALRTQLVDFASLIELELDFGEEDVAFADRAKLQTLVEKIQDRIRELLRSFDLGNAIKEGITTVIAGRPNAGKSTLLNALLNEDRAIVSEIAGTTRDTIEEVLHIKGVPFRIIDTAGIREAQDTVEAIGVEKTMEKVAQSSLLIYVFDVVQMQPADVRADLAKLYRPGLHLLVVANKMDLNPYTKYEHYFRSSPGPSSRGGGGAANSTEGSPPPEEGPGEELGMWLTADKRTYTLLKARARELRKNMTDAEQVLWARIRRRQLEGAEFRRQHIVGRFIPDFLNLQHKLVIEVDGGYHQLEEVQLRDDERAAILAAGGYTVLRFSNEEILDDVERVAAVIGTTLRQLQAHDLVKESATEQAPVKPDAAAGIIRPDAWVPISAVNKMNISYLEEKLYEAVLNQEVDADQTIVSNARHYASLQAAYTALDAVLTGMSTGVTNDFVAMDIRRALYHLGEITGEISPDDLLGNIFGKFCIGK